MSSGRPELGWKWPCPLEGSEDGELSLLCSPGVKVKAGSPGRLLGLCPSD